MHETYRRARDALTVARDKFDGRQDARDHATADNDEKIHSSDGPEGILQRKFDMVWLLLIGQLTRQLVDAEDTHQVARAAAIKAGCDLSDGETSSVFDNNASEGYSPSFEQGCKVTAPKPMIED